MRASSTSGLFALATLMLAAPALDAQRYESTANIDGDETCRPIWREFGRSMNGRAAAVYCEIREIGTTAKPATIEVDGGRHNGVLITGAARSDMRVRLVIQAQGRDVAEARSFAQEVRFDLSRTPLQAIVPEFNDGNRRDRRFVSATIVIDAPVESNIWARAEHAPMEIENVRGRIDVNGAHGPVGLRNVGGDVRARVAHGPLDVYLSGTKWDGTGLDAHAQHGPLTLRLPRDFGAELEIGAEHGPMDSEFPLTLSRFDRSFLQTRLGAGGPRIRAIASHGPMSLRIAR
jgi:hypothetical protein